MKLSVPSRASWFAPLPTLISAVAMLAGPTARCADELCAYWPMDESSGTVVPNDAATADANLYNGATWVAGTINNALSFNGVNQYVTGAVTMPLTNTAVSMWFRTSQAGGGLYSATNQSGSSHDRHIYLNGGNIYSRIWNEETISSTGKNYADGQWHQVVHTFGGVAGGQKLYVDGVLIASGNKSASDFNTQTHIQLGYSISSPTRFFNGQLDDVRIWNRALNAAEAQALAQRSGTANYPNPPFAGIIGGSPLKLDWLAPTGATSHDLYLGDNPDIVNSTPLSEDFMGNFTTKPLDVADATPGNYYWRVDERLDSTVFKGSAWSFQYLGGDGSNAINFTQPTAWWVGANDSFLQSGVLSGSGTFYKDGPGTLVLTGNNTNSGSTIIRDGILQIGDGGTSGSLGSGPVTVNSTLAFKRSDNITFSGTLNGIGDVIQQGPGGLTLSGTGITYTGNTVLNGGSLAISGTPNFNSAIQINAGQLSFNTTSNYTVAPKVISGAGPVQVNGNNGNWTRFTADNTYSGGTLINPGGMLLLGNITPAGSVLGDITNNGTLGLYHSTAWTFSNNVSGTGAINLYSPSGNSVTVSGNTLSLANLNASQNPGGILTNTTVNLTGALNLSSNSTLTIGSGANITVAGGMTQAGNAYNHTMSTLKVTGGNLTFGGQINDGWDGAYTVTQTGGTVRTPGITGGNGGGEWSTNTYNFENGTLILGANGINGPYYKAPWFGNGGGLTLNLNFGGGTLSASANWSTSRGLNLTGINGNLTVAPDSRTITLNGAVSGAGGINLTGTGNLILAGNNTYAGGTAVGAGTTLQLGNNTASGSIAGDIANNGLLKLYRNNAWTFSNNVTGNGTLNLYSPGGNAVTISGNTLSLATLNANQNPGGILTNTTVNVTGGLNLATNSTLTVGPGANVTVAGGMTQATNAYNNTMSTLKISGGNITFGGIINDGWDGAYSILQTSGTLTALGITGGNGGGEWTVNTITLEGGTLVLGANGISGPANKAPWFANGGGLTMNLNFGGATLSANANWTSGWGMNLTGTNGNLTVSPAGYAITVNRPVTGIGGIDLTGSGKLILAGANTYSGTTTVGVGTTFGGAGGMTGPVNNYGTIAPGNTGSGKLTVKNTLTMAPDTAIEFQVTDWFGAPGLGCDRIAVNSLDLTATPEDPVTIRISAPSVTHFNEVERTFVLIESTDPISSYDPAKFVIDATAFTVGQGTWSLRKTGNSIELVYGNYTDTDGDGTPDWKERDYYHTNPNVANTIVSSDYATIPAHDYASATGHWSRDDSGSLIALERRGEVTFPLTVASGDAGVFEISFTGGATGSPRPTEYLPLIFSINGSRIGSSLLPSVYGGSSTITLVTPWLPAGTHNLSILHDNYRGDLQLRIDSLQIRKLTGLEQRLTSENQLTRIPASSLTSPVCVEGITSQFPSVLMTAAGTNIPATESIDSTFFANIPLGESAVTLNTSFQSGAVTETHSIEWAATNLCQHTALDIRLGDSLRLDAWTGGAPSGTFTVKLNGTLLADSQSSTTHTSGQPLIATFNTAGTHTLVATLSDQTVHTVTLRVHSANFGPGYSVRAKYSRDWVPTSLGSSHLIQADSRLTWQEITSGSNPRKFRVTPREAGQRHVLARLPDSVDGAPGAILACGSVNAYYLASIDETADPTEIMTYPDGTRLLSGTFVAVGLPADIRIRLKTMYQGTVFANGSIYMWLTADDFDENGIATVYYERAGTGYAAMCTYLDIYVTPPAP